MEESVCGSSVVHGDQNSNCVPPEDGEDIGAIPQSCFCVMNSPQYQDIPRGLMYSVPFSARYIFGMG